MWRGGTGTKLALQTRLIYPKPVRTGFISVQELSSDQIGGDARSSISGQRQALSVRTGFYSTRFEASGVSPSEIDYLIRSLVDRDEALLSISLADRDEPCPYREINRRRIGKLSEQNPYGRGSIAPDAKRAVYLRPRAIIRSIHWRTGARLFGSIANADRRINY